MSIQDNDKPPLFNSWKGWYIAIIVFLVTVIILLSLFTKYFS